MMKKTVLALTLLVSLLLTFTACGEEESKETTAAKPQNTTSAKQNTSASTPAENNPTTPPASEENPGEGDEGGDDVEFSDDEVDLFIPKGTIEIDGVKDEAWSAATPVQLEIASKDNPSEDTVVMASAMWDENAIYFLFEITDAQIFHGGAVGDYNNDGVYLYICEDAVEIFASSADSYGFGAYQFALINKDLEMLPRKGSDGNDLKAQSAYTMTTDGMIIEFCYTFSTGKLAEGSFIGLDYQYNDSEESGVRLGAYKWYNGTDGDFNTMNMAIAKLVEKIPG